tara:strand:+ start:362 stop:922 length:561 start_codon:yes stop_codon:yes gene_type:complete
MMIAFIGPDMTGKSNIAAELSKQTNIPVFKNSGEWNTELGSPDYFLNLLRYGGPFLMDFMRQTNANVILDRFYPCELVYAECFERETDYSAIRWMDQSFAKAGGKFIVCVRKDYSGLIDDQYPEDLPTEMLERLDEGYRKWANATNCECLILETDDKNLNNQIKKIKMFLGINKKDLIAEDFCAYT